MPWAFVPGIIKEEQSLNQSLNIFNTADLTQFLRRNQLCHFTHAHKACYDMLTTLKGAKRVG
jgi:hypothetical protein